MPNQILRGVKKHCRQRLVKEYKHQLLICLLTADPIRFLNYLPMIIFTPYFSSSPCATPFVATVELNVYVELEFYGKISSKKTLFPERNMQ